MSRSWLSPPAITATGPGNSSTMSEASHTSRTAEEDPGQPWTALDSTAPRTASVRGAGTRRSDVHHGARERAGDAVEGLHLGDHELAELVDVAGLGAHDDVIGTGDVLGHRDALDLGDRVRHLRGLADVGLDQDVGLHHHVRISLLALRCGGPGQPIAPLRHVIDKVSTGSALMRPCRSRPRPPWPRWVSSR